ncbi:hypothetical protein GOP47_0025147 [Adiantum capillus-veneris]|uniref:Uncharacterized protein n=1 Tax=Adiantum capillus-veneris TaxID=13818 RepID=A0A9D4Z4Y4_ADICA|nr:hypothetical protein GOP47_0025147 [Adiantum capillus-veneris]
MSGSANAKSVWPQCPSLALPDHLLEHNLNCYSLFHVKASPRITKQSLLNSSVYVNPWHLQAGTSLHYHLKPSSGVNSFQLINFSSTSYTHQFSSSALPESAPCLLYQINEQFLCTFDLA